MFIRHYLASGCLVVILGTAVADEQQIAIDQLPKAVADAVKKKFPGAEFTGASKETENGKTLYEASIKHKGQKIDVTATPAGVIELIEKEIAAKALPAAVRAAIDKKYPHATLRIIEEIMPVKDGKETLEAYEFLLVTAEKKTWEVTASPAGKITKEEAKKGD